MASLGTSLTPTPFHSDETATECLMKLCLFHHCAQGEGGCWEGTQGPGQGSSHPRIGRKPSEWILEGDSQSPRGREAFAGKQQSCWNLYLSTHKNTRAMCRVFTFCPAYWRQDLCHETAKSSISCSTRTSPTWKKSTNTILVVFYHSRSKCWEGRLKEWFLFAKC